MIDQPTNVKLSKKSSASRQLRKWYLYSLTLIAALLPPWLVLTSTALRVFAKNQTEFNNQISVVYPFVLSSLAIGASIALIASILLWKKQLNLLWPYFLFPIYFAISLTALNYGISGTYLTLINCVLIAVFFSTSFYLVKNITLIAAVPILSMLSVVTISIDLYQIEYTHVQRKSDSNSLDNQKIGFKHNNQNTKPNIYHFIFDEFQTDLFELGISEMQKEEFSGFTFFRDTATQFGRTQMSLATIFSGKSFDPLSDPLIYINKSMTGKNSILHWIKQDGYRTISYIHPVFPFSLPHIDQTTTPDDLTMESLDSIAGIFHTLWLYSVLPPSISQLLIDPEQSVKLAQQNLLTSVAPIKSLYLAKRMITEEESLPAHGRYTLAHLIIPHFPYVLDEKCEFNDTQDSTSPLKQAQCAINLMVEIIRKLKSLGRYNDSVIIFQSDHGARYSVDNKALKNLEKMGFYSKEWSRARSRTLLLIKPAGAEHDRVLSESDLEVSLIDVAPTLVALASIRSDIDFDGFNLFSNSNIIERKQRLYYFYDKKDRSGKKGIYNLTQFVLQGDSISDGKRVHD